MHWEMDMKRFEWLAGMLRRVGVGSAAVALLSGAVSVGGQLTDAEKALINDGKGNAPMRILTVFDENDDRVLRAVSTPIENPDDDDIRLLVARMSVTVRRARGNGIAAAQVGINRRVMLTRRFDQRDAYGHQPMEICFNPELIKQSDGKATEIEACLSMPGYSGPVERSTEIGVRYTNARGEVIEETMTGDTAVNFLHELDHLDGIMYTDRLKDQSLLKQCFPWEYHRK